MLRRHLLSACLFVLMVAGSASGPAQSAGPLEKNFWLEGPRYDSLVPPCEAMLGEIAERFAKKEGKFWNSSLQITGFAHVREIAFRSREADTIPRRFCTAKAAISDGKVRTVNYAVIEDGGFASFSPGVEFCVIGLDRNWAFNPACRMARP